MAQLYQIQVQGGIKHDFAVNITNQGPSTVVKNQPKQIQSLILLLVHGFERCQYSSGPWLTAFQCYMGVY